MVVTAEDTITESKYTKITSKACGSEIVITVYARVMVGMRERWDADDDYRISLDEFETMRDKLIYLVMKYKSGLE